MHIEQTSTRVSSATYRVRRQNGDGRHGVRRCATNGDAKALVARLQLFEVDRAQITLGGYVAQVWIPIYARVFAPINRATHQYIYANHVGPHLGSVSLRGISVELIAGWKFCHLQLSIDPRSVRRALLVPSGILQTAVRAHYYLETNPARTLLGTVVAG